MDITKPELLAIDRKQRERAKRRNNRDNRALAILLAMIMVTLLWLLVFGIIDSRCSAQLPQTKIAGSSHSYQSQKQTSTTIVDRGNVAGRETIMDNERDLAERVVAAEARGESQKGMEAVAQVIIDRSVTWGQTITQVCTAPDQFADPYQGDISPEVKSAVSAVFDQGVRIWEDSTTHFCSGPTVYWENKEVKRGSIGGHRFYS